MCSKKLSGQGGYPPPPLTGKIRKNVFDSFPKLHEFEIISKVQQTEVEKLADSFKLARFTPAHSSKNSSNPWQTVLFSSGFLFVPVKQFNLEGAVGPNNTDEFSEKLQGGERSFSIQKFMLQILDL